MIHFDVYSNQGRLREFRVRGHAGYDDSGRDIVCAAVSFLVINTINSCEQLTHTFFQVNDMPDDMVCRAPEKQLSETAHVLVQSLFYGMDQLQEQYPEFVQVNYHQS